MRDRPKPKVVMKRNNRKIDFLLLFGLNIRYICMYILFTTGKMCFNHENDIKKTVEVTSFWSILIRMTHSIIDAKWDNLTAFRWHIKQKSHTKVLSLIFNINVCHIHHFYNRYDQFIHVQSMHHNESVELPLKYFKQSICLGPVYTPNIKKLWIRNCEKWKVKKTNAKLLRAGKHLNVCIVKNIVITKAFGVQEFNNMT